MAVLEIHPKRIHGSWNTGFALDFHTTSSTPIGENQYGHMQFDTVRPPIAELLYQLKYRGDRNAAPDIIETSANFLRSIENGLDLIVPVPPSTPRLVQPVNIIADGIGAAMDIPVSTCVSTTRPTAQLKEVTDQNERAQLLNGLYTVDPSQTRGRNILLFDDFYRSGSTLNAITQVLLNEGEAASVRVLTITKTRSRQ